MNNNAILQRALGLTFLLLGLLVLYGWFDLSSVPVRNVLGMALSAGGALLLAYQSRLAHSLKNVRLAEAAAAEDQARLGAIVETVGDALITISPAGTIESFNPAACDLFGYAPAEVIGQNVSMLIPLEERDEHEQDLQQYRSTGTSFIVGKRGIERRGLHRDGRCFAVEVSINEVKVNGRILLVGIVRDIGERKAAQTALYVEKERLNIALAVVGDAVITTDTAGNISYLNPVAEHMTGWTATEACGRALEEVFRIVDANTRDIAPNQVAFVLSNGETGGLAPDTVLLAKGGGEWAIDHAASPIRDENGAISGAVLVFHDVSEARLLAERMSHQAAHDALTGLINRHEFERRIMATLDQVPGNKGHALLYLDLDQFKLVNDTCGHIAGDELLKQITAVLQGELRDSDVLARMGGDEFAVLLENCPLEAANRVAETLRQAVARYAFSWDDKNFALGVSIGLVAFVSGTTTLSEVLMAADSACYVAKDKGRNRIHVYESQDVELKRRNGEMGWVSRIQLALQEQRFCLYAQPIVEVSQVKDAFVHFELLIRMRDEHGELVPPMAFIPAAERYNLMPQIDRWVIQHAFTFLHHAYRGGQDTLRFAINLSGASLNDESLFGFIMEQFEQFDIPRTAVCFEVTETSAISNLTQASRLITELRQAGCQFSLDDFGSGMSSFAYLKHLPVDFLKIDGGFVKDMAEDPIDHAMVEAINNIGHVMGIKTIAEFVENDRILECLHLLGVNYAQGYGISKPFPLEQLSSGNRSQEALVV